MIKELSVHTSDDSQRITSA